MHIASTIIALRRAVGIGALALAALAFLLGVYPPAAAQQAPWPTRPGERWVLAGPFPVDLAKGSQTISLKTVNGSVRALRIGSRNHAITLTSVGMRYADGAQTLERRQIALSPRDRTRALVQTRDERFADAIELTFAPVAGAAGPALIEVWLLQTAAGAVAIRPEPKAPPAAPAAPAPAPQAKAAAPSPPPAAKAPPAPTIIVMPPLPALPPPPAVAAPPPAAPAPAKAAAATSFPVIPPDRLWPVLLDAWRTSDPSWQARLVQDQTMQECYVHANMPPKAVANAIQAREKARIEYPADGNFVGSWKKGEALAQNGYGLRFTDTDPKREIGGNCYACHQLGPNELSYGTVGPSLREYGKLRKYAAAEAKAVYERIFNPQAALACANMPRFGTNRILTIEQIKDLVALLMDPESPVNK